MTGAALQLDAITARRLFLDRHDLCRPVHLAETRRDLASRIDRLGFVQVDSVQTVARAHHQILFSRNATYRQNRLGPLIERGALFENWTHDAAVIPSAFFPYWRHRFRREEARLRARWTTWHGDDFHACLDRVRDHIADRGCTRARDLAPEQPRSEPGWWNWHPDKVALEYLWRTGEIAIARREGFQKVYDLTERVLPAETLNAAVSETAFVDWACRSALARLGTATPGEIARFWALISPAEAKAWTMAQTDLIAVETDLPSGTRKALALPDLPAALDAVCDPPARLRVLSPFDPALRDRARALRLFGFDYRIEIFTPAEKRRYGYYVFPLLDGERFVGRIDMKADRGTGTLAVTALWPEPGVRWGKGREERLVAELDRIARFAGLDGVTFEAGWRR